MEGTSVYPAVIHTHETKTLSSVSVAFGRYARESRTIVHDFADDATKHLLPIAHLSAADWELNEWIALTHSLHLRDNVARSTKWFFYNAAVFPTVTWLIYHNNTTSGWTNLHSHHDNCGKLALRGASLLIARDRTVLSDELYCIFGAPFEITWASTHAGIKQGSSNYCLGAGVLAAVAGSSLHRSSRFDDSNNDNMRTRNASYHSPLMWFRWAIKFCMATITHNISLRPDHTLGKRG